MIAVLLGSNSQNFTNKIDALNGVSYHRLFVPFLDLKRQGYPVTFYENFKELNKDHLAGARYTHLVISRAFTTKDPKAFHAAHKKAGIKIVIDIDDWWELYDGHPIKHKYMNDTYPYIIQSLQNCDIILTTHKKLAKKVEKINKRAKIHIVPNAIDYNWHQWQVPKRLSNELTFGYLGAASHTLDIKEIGYNFKEEGKNLWCIDIADFPQVLGATEVGQPLAPKEYGTLYGNFHVSLAPLVNNEFNKCKSNLKVLEAAATTTAFIGSKMHPYEGMIEHGVTGWLAKDKREWREIIEGMTIDKAMTSAQALRSYLEGFNVTNVNNIRKQALGL